jgi:hypothetical protein
VRKTKTAFATVPLKVAFKAAGIEAPKNIRKRRKNKKSKLDGNVVGKTRVNRKGRKL